MDESSDPEFSKNYNNDVIKNTGELCQSEIIPSVNFLNSNENSSDKRRRKVSDKSRSNTPNKTQRSNKSENKMLSELSIKSSKKEIKSLPKSPIDALKTDNKRKSLKENFNITTNNHKIEPKGTPSFKRKIPTSNENSDINLIKLEKVQSGTNLTSFSKPNAKFITNDIPVPKLSVKLLDETGQGYESDFQYLAANKVKFTPNKLNMISPEKTTDPT